MTERKEIMWCPLCGARFTNEEVQGWGCPKCKNQGTPCGCNDDVRVEVNWHELRILGIWAENYARQHATKDDAPDGPNGKDMPKIVTAIARRLQRQFPDLPPLTLSQEIADLPAALEKSGIKCGMVESNVPRPELLPINGPGAVGHSRGPAPE